jgi:hypothetical protein
MNAFSRARLLAAGVNRKIWPALRYFSRVLHLISLRELRSPLMEVILRKCDRLAAKVIVRSQGSGIGNSHPVHVIPI